MRAAPALRMVLMMLSGESAMSPCRRPPRPVCPALPAQAPAVGRILTHFAHVTQFTQFTHASALPRAPTTQSYSFE